jgi:hypothetical protein
MDNNAIFSKSILCALALFGFSSATAVQQNCTYTTVVVGGSSPQTSSLLLKRIGDFQSNSSTENTGFGTNHIDIRFEGVGIGASINNVSFEKKRTDSALRFFTPYIRNADVVLLLFQANETSADNGFRNETEEIEFYFNKINEIVRNEKALQKAIVLVEGTNSGEPAAARFEAFHAWCENRGVESMNVLVEKSENVPALVDMIEGRLRDRIAERQPSVNLRAVQRQDRCSC